MRNLIARTPVRWALASAAISAAVVPASAQESNVEIGAAVAGELRVFVEEPLFEPQLETFQPSLTVEPDLRWSDDSGRHQIVVLPFFRVDGADEERTHFDLREGYYRYIGDDFEVLLGAAKVFWGVTESRHLVDIINQTDVLEDIDEEDKLGQPMVKATFFRDWGQLDFFYLPYVRERSFPGEEGRLRFPFDISEDGVIDADGEEWAPSGAARYSHYFGSWDVGLSVFHGISREPRLTIIPPAEGEPVPAAPSLVPVYDQITQFGTTAQYTNDAWLWKFEGIVREGQGDTFGAVVAGVEYTFFGVTESGADLGVLVEYLYDGRDEDLAPPTISQNDVFAGARLALNDIQDTSLLAGAIVDAEDGSVSALIEGQRRLGENWTAEVEGRIFTNVDEANLLAGFEKDSVLSFRLTRYY